MIAMRKEKIKKLENRFKSGPRYQPDQEVTVFAVASFLLDSVQASNSPLMLSDELMGCFCTSGDHTRLFCMFWKCLLSSNDSRH
jgi:hypothetical protein